MDFGGIIENITGGSIIGDLFEGIFGGGDSQGGGTQYGGGNYDPPVQPNFSNVIAGFLPIILIGIVLLLVIRK